MQCPLKKQILKRKIFLINDESCPFIGLTAYKTSSPLHSCCDVLDQSSQLQHPISNSYVLRRCVCPYCVCVCHHSFLWFPATPHLLNYPHLSPVKLISLSIKTVVFHSLCFACCSDHSAVAARSLFNLRNFSEVVFFSNPWIHPCNDSLSASAQPVSLPSSSTI